MTMVNAQGFVVYGSKRYQANKNWYEVTSLGIKLSTVRFPKEYYGKRVRFRVELVE